MYNLLLLQCLIVNGFMEINNKLNSLYYIYIYMLDTVRGGWEDNCYPNPACKQGYYRLFVRINDFVNDISYVLLHEFLQVSTETIDYYVTKVKGNNCPSQ